VPVFRSTDVTVLQRSELNFDGMRPQLDTLWYGEMKFQIQDEQYTIDEFLNSGSEGQTYLITQISTGSRFAAKFCWDQDSKEVKLLKKMPRSLVMHQNFLTYEKIVLDVHAHFAPAHHIIIMEHVPNGELFSLLTSQETAVVGKPVSEGSSRRFLHDIINGVAECYMHGISHRDLKPENMLIDERGNIIIIDLGHAKHVDAQPQNSDQIPMIPTLARTSTVNQYGSDAFNAPEVAKGLKYDCELADVWSVGVIAFLLHARLHPFDDSDGVASFFDCTGTENERFWAKIKSSGYYTAFPDSLMKFINSLWRYEPSERPTFSQLLRAIRGDEMVISEFPGLAWLAQPVNDRKHFIDELRAYCPEKTFRYEG